MFVANMTGNVVVFGFVPAGVGGVSAVASLLAIVAFVAGAALGGRLISQPRAHRGFLLAARWRRRSWCFVRRRVLLRWVATPAPLWLATVLLLACAIGAYVRARSPRSAAWR